MDTTTTTEADMPDFIEQRLGSLTEAAATLPSSSATFDDGGSFRVEIPSVEGPAAMDAVVTEAERLDVPLHRVSQGSGITLLSDAEILEMAAVGAAKSIEVCLFVGPRAPWEGSASALTPDGKVFGWRHTSVRQLRYAYDDVVRAVELGIRSILIADEGLICLVDEARRAGELPQDLILKGSALMGIANPVGAALLERAGLDTINVASDAPLGELAAFRAARSALDLYVESPDGLGGFTRYHELAEIVRVASPIHLKFGLRNAPSIYPSGLHLEGVAVATGRERVRRAALGLERLANISPETKPSPTGLPRAGVPVPR
jgi:hypothetical protein